MQHIKANVLERITIMNRTFEVSAYSGEQNRVHTERVIIANSAFAAATQFAEEFGAEVYSVRSEQPVEVEGFLSSVWSAGWSGSGLRIWIKEQL